MNWFSILVAPTAMRWCARFAVMLGSVVVLGCTPTMDWRVVHHADGGWKALFPAKPVEVSRNLVLPSAQRQVTLTLKSARIDHTMYAVGHIANGSKANREELEAAMLANIRTTPDQVVRSEVLVQNHRFVEIRANGLMLVDPVKPAVPARLIMRSALISLPSGLPARVIEIIAVGPKDELTEEHARQFVDSLELVGL